MDQFVVSARKYRPATFADVVGQRSLADTLKKAVVSGRLASAYLFCGPRGVGKTTCARIFAKAINCLNPKEDGEACETCECCTSFNEQRSVNIQELNAAANNSVEDIRQIIEQVRIPPQVGKYKVIILDEVHMLSTSASNALLKTLEEPPSYVVFILATTEKQKILPTILSRCQIFDFNRMSIADIVGNLKMVAGKEGITYDERALGMIAQKADGGMRDALSIFDQMNSFSSGNITYESVLRCLNALDTEYYFQMTDLLLESKVSRALLLFNDVLVKGFDGGVFAGGMASHLRNVLVCRDEATVKLLDTSEQVKQQYLAQARKCTSKFLYKAIAQFDRCSNEYRLSYNKRLSVELTIIMVAQLAESPDEVSGLGPELKLKSPKKTLSAPAPSAADTPVAQPSATHVEQPVAVVPERHAPAGIPPVSAERPIPPRPKMIAIPSIKNIGHAPVVEQTPSQSDASLPSVLGTDSFSELDLKKVWAECIAQLPPEEGALKGRMEHMQLVIQDDAQIEVQVLGEQVEIFLKPYLPRIESYLQHKLNNGKIHLTVKVKASERKVLSFNPAEYYKRLTEENECLALLREELDLILD